jgi:hypothetical protein
MELVAAGSGLIAGAQRRPTGERPHEPTDRRLVVEDAFDRRSVLTGVQHAGDEQILAGVEGSGMLPRPVGEPVFR